MCIKKGSAVNTYRRVFFYEVIRLNPGKKKKPFLKRAADFTGDKGFYIVLFLCVAVIGAAARMISSGRSGTELVELPQSGDPTLSAPATRAPFYGDHSPEPPPALTVPPREVPDEPQPGADEAAAETLSELPPEEPEPVREEPAVLHFQWPLSGTVETPHSVDALIYDSTMADWRTHAGMDISAPIGTLVMASSDGSVADVYDDGMYGTTVILRHSGGMTSIYSNLAATPAVSVGDTVRIGEVIGSVGDTALAETGTVSHLHFGMTLDGVAVDPGWYLPKR